MARAALPDHRPALVPAVQAQAVQAQAVQAQAVQAQAAHLPAPAVRVQAPVLPEWKRYPHRLALTLSV